MSNYGRGSVYSVPVLGPASNASNASGRGTSNANATNSETISQLQQFLQEYREGETFLYRDRLRANLLRREYTLEVEVAHLIGWNQELAARCRTEPGDIVPLFERALRQVARAILSPTQAGDDEAQRVERLKDVPHIQLQLRSGSRLMQFRELGSQSIARLVRVPGIVVSATIPSSRALAATHYRVDAKRTFALRPTERHTHRVHHRTLANSAEGGSSDCPLDPYVIVHGKSTFVDAQTIKLQEAPDMVPTGELPRHLYLTGKVVPGTRIIATGIYSTFQQGKGKKEGNVALRTPYLRVLGLELDSGGTGRGSRNFTAEEEEEFNQMSRGENFYERFANSIAPSIYGNTDIKKAVACLLFGGSKKVLPDGMRLRGDINVLLLGDPGTAKSQLLKFVEKASPISVYTSGKGSSAAGLTASVQRDPSSREFYLEGGAMVLADGGVVCIDEFDKMRDEDRVAIHEAMEQQTISIAKAGITTILNSRTSVLAAANPVFGRYDDMKTPGENIDFQTTILSRFDMIFIVKDEHEEGRDRTIAHHIMNIHMNRATTEQAVGEIDIDQMKRYVSYAKSRCAPRLSPEAAEKLSSHFVALRKQVQQVERDNNERSSIPITVRQLEAIIRISESLAKMTLSTQVHEHHVDEAIRLFKFSTMDAVQAGNVEGMTRGDLMEEINKVESDIRRRLPIGWSTSYASLVNEFVTKQGYTQHALERTLYILERREVIRFSGAKRTVHRIGV
ncbi:minichromosome maintenance protein 5 [Microbotryomycetes sp. JL201]|nr:minichromosome maintenance protein 5 [Microbotryomycetes sp. JL201]